MTSGNSFTHRKIKLVNRNNFCNDLESSLNPILQELMQSPCTPEVLDKNFSFLVKNISNVIDKHTLCKRHLEDKNAICRNFG